LLTCGNVPLTSHRLLTCGRVLLTCGRGLRLGSRMLLATAGCRDAFHGRRLRRWRTGRPSYGPARPAQKTAPLAAAIPGRPGRFCRAIS